MNGSQRTFRISWGHGLGRGLVRIDEDDREFVTAQAKRPNRSRDHTTEARTELA